MAPAKAIRVKVSADHDEGDPDKKLETEKVGGFYILLSGPKVVPLTRSFRTGSHGTGKGRLTRGARWALRAISSESSHKQGDTEDAAVHLYSRGFRILEVLEFVPKKGAKKTEVRAELIKLIGKDLICPCGKVECPDIDTHSEVHSLSEREGK